MPSTARGLCRALLLAVCAWPGLARAEHTTVDTVIVTANPDPEDPPVVGDARKALSETPGAVAVVAAEAYADRHADGLEDVLRDVPGVYAQKKFGGDIRLSIRGSGLGNNNHNRGVLLAQDGVPFNEADGFGDFQLIDPLIARYTEVWKGGNALRFGGALLGGAVNVVTPTGRTAEDTTRLRLDGGSWGTGRAHLELAGTYGDWDGFAAATDTVAQGWRSQSQQNAQYLSANLGRSFGEDREVRLILSGGNIDQEIAGALTKAQLADPRAAAPANLALDYHRNMRAARGVLQTRWRLSPTTVLQAGAYAIWKDLDHPIFQVIDQESRNLGGFARIDWEGEVAGRRADAYSGLWLRQGDLDSRNWLNLAGARGALLRASRQNARAVDAFAEGRLFVTDRLAAVVGGTYGWTDRDFAAVVGTEGAHSADYDWFAPRVGLLWEAESGAQAFANLTRSVEPPNFGALAPNAGGFRPLDPQSAWTLEAGTRGRAAKFVWDVSAYRAEIEDELLTFDNTFGTGVAFNASGGTIHQGIDAALDWRPNKRWRLRQSWSWSDFRFEDDPVYGDNRLPIVPPHLYRAELRYDDGAWWIAPSVEWAPKGAYVDFHNTTRADGYAIASLNAGWRPADRVGLYLDARNLADEGYVSNVSAVVRATSASAVYWPGEGRGLFAGITYDF